MPSHLSQNGHMVPYWSSENSTEGEMQIKDDEIVISGMAGRFPESDNVEEFWENLVNGRDMVKETDERWPKGLFNLPSRSGLIKDATKLDAVFFGIAPKQAQLMVPETRNLLELVYECLVDAGQNPIEMRGKRIGVYVGNSSCETEDLLNTHMSTASAGYSLLGAASSMLTNRISFSYDFKGPSVSINAACTSSAQVIDVAIRDMRTNKCEAALVAGANFCLRPSNAIYYMKRDILSPDGKSRVFDYEGNGYARADAVAVLFLQRARHAKRIYASIVHITSKSSGARTEDDNFPNEKHQIELFEETYKEAKVNPNDISYLEAHGTGIKREDIREVNAVSKFFCKNRTEPLLMGSVKSNMGFSEGASGIVSIIKVLLAMYYEVIPPNLNFKKPDPSMTAIVNGEIIIPTKPTPWKGELAAVNNYGRGGVNAHIILRGHKNCNSNTMCQSPLPRIIAVCCRTESGLQEIMKKIETTEMSEEDFALLDDVNKLNASLFEYRGYILKHKDTSEVTTESRKIPQPTGPVWYVFTGMGSQWPKMGQELMKLDLFNASILHLNKALKPFGIDLIHLLTEADEHELSTTTASFISIAAVQIAIVDVLNALGIKPDGMIGHSIGEVACAYADGCITAEQAIIIAYWRGKCIDDAKLPRGGMAAIGLTLKDLERRLPRGLAAACHNARDSVTVSGLEEEVMKFVEEMKSEAIFAKYVHTCGIAFHSPFMKDVGPPLKAALEKVIPQPRGRSSRWISTSILKSEWNTSLARFASPDYFVNNLLSPVFFEEGIQNVPSNAIVIEIAPHSLLQAILKRCLSPSCKNIGITKKTYRSNLEHFLISLGKLHLLGVDIPFKKLYPVVRYPVSKGTMMLSNLLRWDHSQSWFVANWRDFYEDTNFNENVLNIDISNPNDEMAYVAGHCIDGRILFPATGYLIYAWRVFSRIAKRPFGRSPIAFEDCVFHRATMIPKSGTVRLTITVHPKEGKFEICEGGSVACSGRIYIPNKDQLKKMSTFDDVPIKLDEKTMVLTEKDIYTELRLKGYDYKGAFQSLERADLEGTQGMLKWNCNFTTFLDGMMQLAILSVTTRCLRVPTYLRSMIIDANEVNCELQEYFGKVRTPTWTGKVFPVVFDKYANLCIAKGVEIRGLKVTLIQRKPGKHTPILEKYHFVPYNQDNILNHRQQLDLDRYVANCSLMTKAILQNIKQTDWIAINFSELPKVTEDQVKAILEKQHKNGVLLETLKQIYSLNPKSLYQDEVKNIVSEYFNVRKKDKLNQITVNEKALRVALDVAIENLNSKKLAIVEILNKELIGNEVLNYLHISPAVMKLTYTVAFKNADSIALKGLKSNMKSLHWNPVADIPAELQNADLVVAKDPFESKKDMNEFFSSVTNMMGEQCFLLLVRRTSLTAAETLIGHLSEPNADKQQIGKSLPTTAEVLKHAEEKGLVAVSRRSDSIGLLVILFRKVLQISASDQAVIYVKEGDYAWVEDLKKKMADYQHRAEGCNIWLIANDTPTNGIVGLVNCLRQEPGGEKIRCIFQNNLNKKAPIPPFNFDATPYKEILRTGLVMNIFRDGMLGSFRHETLLAEPELKPQYNAYLNVTVKGDLSSFKWFTSPIRLWDRNAKLCDVYYSPLNFRDVMSASGKLPIDALPASVQECVCVLGFEYAGRERATGKRVMGIVKFQAFSTNLIMDPHLFWEVPDDWTLEEACTVPVAYSTTYYAMIVRAKMKKGSSILIHSGSGGVGQAAIAIALSMGCEVFVTVGTYEKRRFLKERFPQLKEENFANSRDTAFENHIMEATKGRGVDVILNSLAEEKLQASVRCMAKFGTFLEIGKYDLSQDNKLGLEAFMKGITFHGVLLDALFDESSRVTLQAKKKVTDLVQEGIELGVVKPLPRKVFNASQAEDAFRFMASGKHIGKVTLKIRDEESEKVTKAPPVTIPALPYTTCDPSKCYVITGGLGGFGLELAGWLIERGAKYLVLSSRSGIGTGYQKLRLKHWKAKGIEVSISSHDVCNLNGTMELLIHAQKFGPIGGIFHLAMVIEDAFIENQTQDTFIAVCDPKVKGTHHLDQASRSICPDVEWFVVFSSLSCGRGNAGQSNYGFANSVMERICERRRKDGLSGIAIQWGAIGDVGIAYDRMGGNDLVIGGNIPQRIFSCMEVLDRFLNEDHPVLSCFVKVDDTSRKDGTKKNLVEVVARILGIKDVSSLSEDTTLGGLGLDSLMGVEVKQTLERDFDIILSMQEVRNLTFGKLAEMNFAYNSENKSEDQASRNEKVPDVIQSEVSCFVIPNDLWVTMNSVKGDKPIFFIHPIEGTVDNLRPLASLLPFPAIGLQCAREALDCNSIEELALFYIKVIQSICPSGPYNIIGYSFGAIPAFEIAILIQERAKSGAPALNSLILIDGSPLFIAYETKAQRNHLKMETPDEEEARYLAGFAKFQGINLNFSELTAQLAKLSNSWERLNYTVEKMLPHMPKTARKDELVESAKAFVRKTHMANNYTPRKKFKGNLTLIKAKTPFITISDMPSDFGLSQVIEGEASIYEVTGDHFSIIREGKENTAKIMKKVLS